MKTIGHITKEFLHLSETFVLRQIVQNQWFRNVVFTSKRKNEHLFPALDLIEIHNKADLAKALEQSRVDLIHAHFGPSALYALSAKKKLGIPMLTFIHGYDARQYPNRTPKKMKQYIELFEVGELFAVPSEAIKQQLIALGCPTEKVIVCHLGVDLSFRFRPRTLDNGEIRLISVGRLVEKKGHNHLIQALSIVQKQIPNFHLTIIGEGAEREELTALIARLGLEEKVSLLGGQSHSKVLNELDRSHIFCLASVTGQDGNMEGLPV
ncbi:glycosyltransferase, partial [Bacillus sp. JJ1533]|uniref:glycosyltransferase n=1 Tax=Bacillus sp. JJ1533 TaxID=3122959 RepID=UPI002FFF8BBF